MEAWGAQYFIWGVLCWLLWFWLGPRLQQAGLSWILTRVVPLGILISVGEEMIWVFLFSGLAYAPCIDDILAKAGI